MSTTKTSIQSTIDSSQWIAMWSNHNYEMSDQCRHRVELLRSRTGRYLLVVSGGMPHYRQTKWITPDAARRFIVEHAMDSLTGSGYTDEETRAILNGESVHGTREFDGGLLLPRPDLADF